MRMMTVDELTQTCPENKGLDYPVWRLYLQTFILYDTVFYSSQITWSKIINYFHSSKNISHISGKSRIKYIIPRYLHIPIIAQ